MLTRTPSKTHTDTCIIPLPLAGSTVAAVKIIHHVSLLPVVVKGVCVCVFYSCTYNCVEVCPRFFLCERVYVYVCVGRRGGLHQQDAEGNV